MKFDSGAKIAGAVFLPMGLIFCGVAWVCGRTFFSVSPGTSTDDLLVFRILMAVFGAVGTVFAAIGLIFLFAPSRAKRRMKLMDTGEPVSAHIMGVERNYSLQVFGRSPYQIICQYNEGGIVYICRSQNFWYDPESLLKTREAVVYRDPKNYKKYYIDLGKALPKTVEL